MRRHASTILALVLLAASGCTSTTTPKQPWSVLTADSIIAQHPHGSTIENDPRVRGPKWQYSTAFAVQAIAQVGVQTGGRKYIDYAARYVNLFLDDTGRIATPTYKPDTFKLDDIAYGPLVLLLRRETGDRRFLTTAEQLARQLQRQPRTQDGGFWHKQIYPHQMWLDGIFMASPFMTQYARATDTPSWYDEAAKQILTIAKHTRDPYSGLYFHGWDESRQQRWADRQTGRSPCIWGRAVGWYAMGIVEVLEQLPPDHSQRDPLTQLFRDLADAIVRVQDEQSGLWYQVLDQGDRNGNYLESSASCMFVYALAKGSRLGLLCESHLVAARRAYLGIVNRFVTLDSAGHVALKDTCRVAGLGGDPYRDGSFEYYIHEQRATNDPKGLAPFILASLEMERKPRR